jgi:hypothetical protein
MQIMKKWPGQDKRSVPGTGGEIHDRKAGISCTGSVSRRIILETKDRKKPDNIFDHNYKSPQYLITNTEEY